MGAAAGNRGGPLFARSLHGKKKGGIAPALKVSLTKENQISLRAP
jgi:hypothetical protein